MPEFILPSNTTAPRPLPRIAVHIRPGTMEDVPFLDALQKLHTRQVGWMPTKQFEGKIKAGHVLVAWASSPCSDGQDTGRMPVPREEPVGYLIGNDQYFKRDDVGIIYQLNVLPGKQRGFIGASLLKAQFERSAYGCKLYSCWCAQDIEANRFWEAMGFVPLAYRAGSETKGPKGSPRVHIFWQKRIRAGDTTTPWWFPSKTNAGSIREDRIVLPIPPGTHWSDAKPMILPETNEPRALATGGTSGERPVAHASGSLRRAKKKAVAEAPAAVRRNGLMFDIPAPGEPLPETMLAKAGKPKSPRAKRACDPRLVSAARELRDRWLERVNETPMMSAAKYDVTRRIGLASADGGPVGVAIPRLAA